MPREPASHRCHARAAYRLDDTETAIADLNKALQLDSGFKPGRFDRGYMYLSQGKNEEAINDFQILIRAEHRLADCYYYLGLAQQNLGNDRAAVRSFETSLLTAKGQLAKDANTQLQVLLGKLPRAKRNELTLYPQVRSRGNGEVPEGAGNLRSLSGR
jgi:tetratricopeptide (TPR) repeat protein